MDDYRGFPIHLVVYPILRHGEEESLRGELTKTSIKYITLTENTWLKMCSCRKDDCARLTWMCGYVVEGVCMWRIVHVACVYGACAPRMCVNDET